MKYLCLQLQPELETTVNKEDLKTFIESIGYKTEITEGNDSGVYINFLIKTENLKELWLSIKTFLTENQNYSKSTIVTCEGSQGWDNYLLLHQFDIKEDIDEI
jgi:hypothetical protein